MGKKASLLPGQVALAFRPKDAFQGHLKSSSEALRRPNDQRVPHGMNAHFQVPFADFQFPHSLEQEFLQDPDFRQRAWNLERMLRARESPEHKAQSLDRPSSSVSPFLGVAREPSLLSQGIILTTGPCTDDVPTLPGGKAPPFVLRSVRDVRATSAAGADDEGVSDGMIAGTCDARGGTSLIHGVEAAGSAVLRSGQDDEVHYAGNDSGHEDGPGASSTDGVGLLRHAGHRRGCAVGMDVAGGTSPDEAAAQDASATEGGGVLRHADQRRGCAAGMDVAGWTPPDGAAAQGGVERNSEFAAEVGVNSLTSFNSLSFTN